MTLCEHRGGGLEQGGSVRSNYGGEKERLRRREPHVHGQRGQNMKGNLHVKNGL